MTDAVDIVVIGAGPAGMTAASDAAAAGAAVVVLDDQPAPGGQVWRAAERVAERGDMGVFGADYGRGIGHIQRFRQSGADYRPGARVIGVERTDDAGIDVLFVRDGAAGRIRSRALIIAVGAYERPTPFPGWTLPGVMTMGAAQIVLKTSDAVPSAPFVLAGQGPLLLLFAWQLRQAGIQPAALLRLDDRGRVAGALKHGPRAAANGFGDLVKGLGWSLGMKGATRDVVGLEAIGDGALERVRWRTADGRAGETDARTLVVHDGVVPNAQLTRALAVAHRFDRRAGYWRPNADPDTGALDDMPGVFLAGDCAGINGWKAAVATGAAAGWAALAHVGRSGGSPPLAAIQRAKGTRPLLDALYPPARAFAALDDATIVCRCEEVTAGDVRNAVHLGAQGPNQLKAFTRAGMGPCQGRMCAMTTAALIAEAQARDVGDVGLQRVRMPIFPVTVGEMAELNETEMALPRS